MDEPTTDPAADPTSGRLQRLLPHLDAFVGFARKRVGDPQLAEDIVQDALVKAVAHVADVVDDERIEAWFYRVLRRTIIDVLRSRHRDGVLADADDVPAVDRYDAQACRCFLGMIGDLDVDQRDAIRLVDLEGIGATEAAARLGITETNLKVRRHRARETLRTMLVDVCRLCAKHGCMDCHCRASSPDDDT